MTRLAGAGLAVRERDESPSGWREGQAQAAAHPLAAPPLFALLSPGVLGKLSLFGMGGARFATSFGSPFTH